jgi:hypothetical protein
LIQVTDNVARAPRAQRARQPGRGAYYQLPKIKAELGSKCASFVASPVEIRTPATNQSFSTWEF